MNSVTFEITPYVEGTWNVAIKKRTDGALRIYSEFAAHEIDGEIVIDSFKAFHPLESEIDYVKQLISNR